jgi:ribosomal-protein-alanine N-acetyltransferase
MAMQQPVFTTPRLTLRPFVLADAPDVQRLAGAAEVADTALNIPHPYPAEVAVAWISGHLEQFATGTAVIWAIVLRETTALCGAISMGIDQQHQHAELGYWLGNPYWNRGYMTEAGAAVLHYGFMVAGLHRIYARHFTRNPASGRVMQKLGMRYEGCLREHMRKGEQFEDLACYAILQREWQLTPDNERHIQAP